MKPHSLRDKVLDRILEAFPDFSFVEVRDVSDAHRQHFSMDKNKQSHFFLAIEDEKFRGMSSLSRHRHVNSLVKEFMEDIHALQMQLRYPNE